MGSRAEWIEKRKESVNLKTEKWKYLDLSNREKNEHNLRDM